MSKADLDRPIRLIQINTARGKIANGDHSTRRRAVVAHHEGKGDVVRCVGHARLLVLLVPLHPAPRVSGGCIHVAQFGFEQAVRDDERRTVARTSPSHAAIAWSVAISSAILRGSSILVCHLPKSAKQMLVVEFADLEIGSAAERYRASMAKYLPKPLRTLYRGGRARAVNRFTSSNAAAIIEIKRQCHEKSDFGHTFALCKFSSCALREASP